MQPGALAINAYSIVFMLVIFCIIVFIILYILKIALAMMKRHKIVLIVVVMFFESKHTRGKKERFFNMDQTKQCAHFRQIDLLCFSFDISVRFIPLGLMRSSKQKLSSNFFLSIYVACWVFSSKCQINVERYSHINCKAFAIPRAHTFSVVGLRR